MATIVRRSFSPFPHAAVHLGSVGFVRMRRKTKDVWQTNNSLSLSRFHVQRSTSASPPTKPCGDVPDVVFVWSSSRPREEFRERVVASTLKAMRALACRGPSLAVQIVGSSRLGAAALSGVCSRSHPSCHHLATMSGFRWRAGDRGHHCVGSGRCPAKWIMKMSRFRTLESPVCLRNRGEACSAIGGRWKTYLH